MSLAPCAEVVSVTQDAVVDVPVPGIETLEGADQGRQG